MKAHIRILIYSVLFFLYLIFTTFLPSLQSKLKTDFYITLGFGFAVFNVIYAFLILKWKPLLNIIFSISIAYLALFLALKTSDLHLFSKYDPYDIKTAIIANAVFSIIFWEVVFQLKKRNNKIVF